MKGNLLLLTSLLIFVLASIYTYISYKKVIDTESLFGDELYSVDQWLAKDNELVANITKTELGEGLLTGMDNDLETFRIELTNEAVTQNDTAPVERKTYMVLPRNVLTSETAPYIYNDTASADTPALTYEELITRLSSGKKRIRVEGIFEDLDSTEIKYIKPIQIFFNE